MEIGHERIRSEHKRIQRALPKVQTNKHAASAEKLSNYINSYETP